MNKRNKKGFTLAELLIVVAIIAVLVAIAIPVFTSQLEKSRENTDIANLRAAKAAAVTAMLSGDIDNTTDAVTKYFDVNKGILVDSSTGLKYGKGTTTVGDSNLSVEGYDTSKSYKDDYIKAVFTKDKDQVVLSWNTAGTSITVGEE